MSKIVERVLDLLELFAAEQRPLSLSDIARLQGIAVSSCHDVLQAMQARGYIYELAPRAGYYPTQRLRLLGEVISEHDPVVARADLLLRSLRDTLDETVLLAKVSGLNAIYLLAFEASHPLRFMVRIGEPIRSLATTSAGKALLGGLDDAALDACLKTLKLAPATANSITSRTALREDIERGRARGWYLNNQESIEGVTTISASFRWSAAAYIVTIAAPSSRFAPLLEEAGGMLTNVCRMLEMRPEPLRR
jgi:DNA-binding IclR family transcriptional regulator